MRIGRGFEIVILKGACQKLSAWGNFCSDHLINDRALLLLSMAGTVLIIAKVQSSWRYPRFTQLDGTKLEAMLINGKRRRTQSSMSDQLDPGSEYANFHFII
jgi:hypothetical protein